MKKYRLLVTYDIREEERNLLAGILGETAEIAVLGNLPEREREQALSNADILLALNLQRELKFGEYGMLKNARLIQLLSAGADHLPFGVLPPRIAVASNVGAYARPMAEHALAMTLALAKHLFGEHQKLLRGEFDQSHLHRMLRGSVCGILGFGGIGRATARLMRALEMKIYALNTSGKTEEQVEFIGTLKDLRHVLAFSDVLVISLPLNKATRGLIGKRELEWMKPDAILVNVARGAIIDEKALYEHLISHPDFKAGIDAWWIEPFRNGVFRTNYPLLTLPNVLGSPHNSALVPGIAAESAKRAAENVMRFIKEEPLLGVVRREDYE